MTEEPKPLQARPAPGQFTAGGLLLQTLQVWWRGAPAYTAVALLVELPGLALQLRAGPSGKTDPLLALLFLWLVNVIAAGAVGQGALADLAGGRPRLGAMLGTVASRLWPIVAVSALYAASILAGTFAFVIPGVVALLAGYVALPAILLRPDLGTEDALRLSWSLTRGHRVSMLWAVSVIVGVSLVSVYGASSWLEKATALSFTTREGIVSGIDVLLSSLTGPSAAVAYHQLTAVYRPEAEASLF